MRYFNHSLHFWVFLSHHRVISRKLFLLIPVYKTRIVTEIITTFQSKFGPEEWLKPYTVEEVARLVEEEELAQRISSLKYTEENRQNEARIVLEIKLLEND